MGDVQDNDAAVLEVSHPADECRAALVAVVVVSVVVVDVDS
jgi:hypothetical protein